MRRVHRDVCHEDTIRMLTNGDFAVFKEIWRLLLFSAALGIKRGRRRKIEKSDPGKAFSETYFSSPGWKGFLYLISLVETGSSNCLRSSPDFQNDLITVFEEYANEGLHILERKLRTSNDLQEVFLDLLQNDKDAPARIPNVADLI
ncbi:DNA phosphorothioation-associated protein 4 [Desulfobacula sp.]|uniref:DNA phosphorothioation-associated protein 4 n=1 Tax=Desulfobacula sp. TaxID=2593537 RepID=UPI001EC43B26|nr:DNA phosphorothioation-associated protein 4 [Desulfobacula sp.]